LIREEQEPDEEREEKQCCNDCEFAFSERNLHRRFLLIGISIELVYNKRFFRIKPVFETCQPCEELGF
jgi:hypothetical protein